MIEKHKSKCRIVYYKPRQAGKIGIPENSPVLAIEFIKIDEEIPEIPG